MNPVYNVVISSKNKTQQDSNSKMVIKLKEDIFAENDEELYVCMSSFNMIKSFYSVQTGLNDHFQVIFRLPNMPTDTYNIFLPEGNYDVNSLKKQIQLETDNVLFDISYVPRLNKYLYKKIVQQNQDPLTTLVEYNVYIKPITAGIFLGLENGIEYEISSQGTLSSKHINLSGYTSLIIKIEGVISIENTISNINNQDLVYDKILGIINISDVAPMDSIKYENSDGCMFRHKINNKKIPSFQITIVNEDGVVFPQMTDWIMLLKFEKVKKDNHQLSVVSQQLNELLFYIKSLYAYIGIPSRLTFEDLIEN